MKNSIDSVVFPDSITITESMIEGTENVQLRCIRLTPEAPKTNKQFVFLPGWISEFDSWRYFLPELADYAEVIYIESREKRTSVASDDIDFSIKTIQSDLIKILDHSDLVKDNYFLGGSSMGATVIMETLEHLTRQPEKVVLVIPNSTFNIPPSIVLLKFIPIPMFTSVRWFTTWFVLKFKVNKDDTDHSDAFVNQITRANMYKLKKSALDFAKYGLDWSILSRFKVPTLVIGARKDNLHQKDGIRKIAESIPGSTFKDLKDFTATHSSKCARLISQWLEGGENS